MSAPEAANAIIRREDHDDIAILVWDDPARAHNIKHAAAVREFSGAIKAALLDVAIGGIVVVSGKRDFVAGGDLGELRRVRTAEEVEDLVGPVNDLLWTFERGGKPVIAALSGAVMGGGLELALAAHCRVATSDVKIGMPELSLGLAPGAGGTQRLPRLIGLETAVEVILGGRILDAGEARNLGLVNDVVQREALLGRSIELARSTRPEQPWFQPARRQERNSATDKAIEKVRIKVVRGASELDIAAPLVLDAMRRGLESSFEQGLALEREVFTRLAVSDAAKNRIRTSFFAVNAARAIRSRPKNEARYEVRRVAVVGAGLMGRGIGYSTALNGPDVLLVDKDAATAEQGVAAIRKLADDALARAYISAEQRATLQARIQACGAIDDQLADVDLAIEAIIESERAKADVLGRLSAVMRPGAPIASNTSTIPIRRLAGYCQRPEEFLGLHFFGPVDRMPLVEVIRGAATTDATLAKALDLVKIMRKVPIIVRDGLGFFTSRVVASYTGEALTLLAEGVPATQIDRVARSFGMPIGPLAMADATGLELLLSIFRSLNGAGETRGVDNGSKAQTALLALTEAKRVGKKAGGIFEPDGAPWSSLTSLFGENASVSDDLVRQRLFHIQALEAVRAMEEGVLSDPSDADLGSVLGWAFPKSYGGVLSYVDTLGIRKFAAECDEIAKSAGDRFQPSNILKEMAAKEARFHEL